MFIVDRLRDLLGRRAYTQESAILLSDNTTWADNDARPNDVSSPSDHRSGKYTTGWRSTVSILIILGLSIFILNLGLTIWCYTKLRIEQGVATVNQGNCTTTKNATTVIHVGINVLSTILLGASTFCMQIMSAPTRRDIDAAHAKHEWLTIGVASFKNLLYIDRKRTVLFWVLGVSSIPLHLLWNSAFLHTLPSNEYIYSCVTESFLEGGPWNISKAFIPITGYQDEAQAMLDRYRNDSLQRLSNEECVKAYYNVSYMTEYSNVLLVYNDALNNDSLLYQGKNSGAGRINSFTESSNGKWVGGRDDIPPEGNASDFNIVKSWQDAGTTYIWLRNSPGVEAQKTIHGSIQYCLAQPTGPACSMGISIPILVTVTIFNAIKLICFISTLWMGGSMYPLLTNGDAIQSFLLRPDTALGNRCLASKADAKYNKSFWSQQSLPILWQGRRRLWAEGAPKDVWLATLIPSVTNLCQS